MAPSNISALRSDSGRLAAAAIRHLAANSRARLQSVSDAWERTGARQRLVMITKMIMMTVITRK